MFRPFTPRLALASLLVGLTATAQAAPIGRSVILTGKAGESPLIYAAPGTVTVILLGAPILRESVQVESRARFAVFEVGDQTVEACRVELTTTRERCEAHAKELEALKARPPALSPAAVALAGFVNERGMRASPLSESA